MVSGTGNEQLRVLWFANTPCSAATKLGSKNHFGGWLSALEQALARSQKTDLSVAFYWHTPVAPFTLNGTTFYPVLRTRRKTSLGRAISRYLNRSTDRYEKKILADVITKCKPHVIHVHGTEENFGMICEMTEIPVVVSLQGILTAYTERFYAGIPRSAVNRYDRISDKAIRSGYNSAFAQMKWRAERELRILGNIKYIAGRTTWDSDISSLLARNARYFHCGEMLREQFYTKVWAKKRFDQVFSVLTTTSNGLYKGLDIIVDAAKLLIETSLNFRWRVAGLSESDPLPSLVKKWKKVNYSHLNIEFLGPCDAKTLCEHLASADVYCQTSHIENSPNSLCEAQLVGVPVVASSAGGTSSLVRDTVTGRLFAPGDPYACAAILLRLSSDFPMAAALGRAGREEAIRRHDPATIINEVVTMYQSMRSNSALN